MKCPKCDYLGFETGDRCRNCGYDFSLMAVSDTPAPDLALREPDPPAAELPPLPLFARAGNDDEPLIKLPAAPRPPLAVRRTPEPPRPRAFARPARQPRSAAERRDVHDRVEPELALQFAAEEVPDHADVPLPERAPVPESEPAHAARRVPRPQPAAGGDESPAVRRILAAIVDVAILFGIDLVVVYFTLRMAGLTMADWRRLPPVPMLAFLGILKLAYFSAFTSMGGQTIGKMAARIQVVADDEAPLDPARAIRRVLAGAVSTLAFGLGFIPALIGPDRRPLHDRVARTRVVARPS